MPARQISKRQATGALVLGIIEILVGIVVTVCSFVLASKAEINVALTPYWAGLPVSKTYLIILSIIFLQSFLQVIVPSYFVITNKTENAFCSSKNV